MKNPTRKRYLHSTALVAMTQLMLIPAAQATDYGLHHPDGSHLILNVAAGQSYTGNLTGILAEFGRASITNAGTIRGNGGSDSATSLPDSGIILGQANSSVVNNGIISGANTGITTIYAWDGVAGAHLGKARNTLVENTGSIIGDQNDGVRLIGGGTVTNSGTIEGRTSPWADGISIYAFADQDTTGQTSLATVANAAGGTIAGARFGLALSVGAAVENDGTITGDVGGVMIQSDPDQPHLSATVANRATISGGDGLWFGGYLASAAVTNSGTIEGTGNAGIFHGTTSTLTLTNATDGVITGALSGVMAEYGAVVIDNAGTIRGNGTSDSATSLPDGGIVLAQPGSKIVNSGTISGANVGITTISAWDDDAGAPVGKARNTLVENTGSIIGDQNDGVRLIGGGTVTNSGTIEGRASPWADGISIYAFADQDTTGQTSLATVANAAGGTIAGARFGLALSAGGNIENDGTITGDVGGLFIQSESRQPDMVGTVTNRGTIMGGDGVQFIGYLKSADLINTGVITGTSGAAVFSITQTTLTNAGTLQGAGGTAVALGEFDDTVILKTGSKVIGILDAGAGDDLLRLSGTVDAATASQTLTRADGFETLHVASGYWSTEGWVGAFDGVSIDAGATLRVNQANLEDGAWSPIHTNQVVNHGLLVFNIDDVEAFDGAESLVISGAGTVRLDGEAILHVANSNIRHTGGTEIVNGGIVLTGSLAGDVTTSNDGVFVIGDGGTDGIFTGNLINNGQFVFNRTDDYDFLGNFSGSGSFEKRGAGTLTFAGGYNFTGVTRILDGFVKFAGEMDPGTQLDVGSGALDLSGGQHTVAGLAGTGGSINIDNGALTVNQASNTEFAGAIAGSGGFNKTGSGRLNLTGTSTYSGPTTVSDGTLSVNGSVASTVTVEGGALGGNGTVGGIIAATGGTVAPGNSIGHLRVAGNVAFTDGSVYAVEATADGEADRITATGSATINGGTLSVLAAEGRYAARTGYTVLIAENGITGTFSEVTSNLAFLTSVLSYSNTSVTLDLLRNDISFASLAATANQRQSAAAVQALGAGNSLFEAVLV
ncbi:MAG TPA: autotransporter-associated beta strand repeat-containing protein, partial [Pedomonas sp.]|uniref:beta strand repeat-containing protein n=1 Tax=Pedomonas sp. TaxID=2976421 RepID=UPI002F3FECB8